MDPTDHQPRPFRPEQGLLEGALQFLSVLWEHRLFIMLVTGIAAALAVGFAIATRVLPSHLNPLPNQFSSNATVLVRQGAADGLSDSALASLAGDARAPALPTGFEYSALLLRMLASRVILDRIAADLDLAPRFGFQVSELTKVRAALLSDSRFLYSRDSGTLAISFQNPDPVLARDVVGRYVTLLGDWSNEMLGSLKEKEKQLLREKLLDVQLQITDLQSELKGQQRKYGFLSPQDLGESQAGTLADLRSQLILKEIDIKNHSSFAQAEDPRLRTLETERKNILDMIAAVEKGLPGSSAGGPSRSDLPEIAQRYANLTLQLEVQQGIYNTLSRQYEIARLTSAPEPVFQTLEMPEIPDLKSGPHRSRIVLVVTILAFVAACGISFLRHAIARLRSRERAAVGRPS